MALLTLCGVSSLASGQQYDLPWKWSGGGSENEIRSACRNAIAGFAIGFEAGLAGAMGALCDFAPAIWSARF